MFDHLKLQNSKNWKKRKLLEAANRTFQIRKYRTCQSFKISIKIGNRQVAQRRRDRNWDKWSGSAIWRGKVLPCYNRKDNEDTHQNLANNSDAVGTTLRIFHKSWRSLSLGASSLCTRPWTRANLHHPDNSSAWKSACLSLGKSVSSSFSSPISFSRRVHSWIIQILFPASDGTLPPRNTYAYLPTETSFLLPRDTSVSLSNEFIVG